MLHIVRHGKAEKHSPTGHDEDRPLAARGERQADWLGELLAGLDTAPTRVLMSPAVRTVQTADRIGWGLGVTPERADWLSLWTTLGAAYEGAASFSEVVATEGVVLVGHEPTVGMLVDALMRGPIGAGDARRAGGISLKTGQCVSLVAADEGWSIDRIDRLDE